MTLGLQSQRWLPLLAVKVLARIIGYVCLAARALQSEDPIVRALGAALAVPL